MGANVLLTGFGDVLTTLFWGALAPSLALPFAALASGRGRALEAGAFLALNLVAFGGAWLFAYLAVDLTAPARPGAAHLATMAIALLVGVSVILARGAAAASWHAARALEPIVRGAGGVMAFAVFAMAGVQFTVVVLRYVFGWNSILMQESVTYFHGAIFMLAAGYALLTNDHVRVDIFYASATPRRRALVDFAGVYLFLFPFCLLIVATAGQYVAASWGAMEGSAEQSGIQAVFLLKSLGPAFAVLVLGAGFILAADAAATLTAGGARRVAAPAGEGSQG